MALWRALRRYERYGAFSIAYILATLEANRANLLRRHGSIHTVLEKIPVRLGSSVLWQFHDSTSVAVNVDAISGHGKYFLR